MVKPSSTPTLPPRSRAPGSVEETNEPIMARTNFCFSHMVSVWWNQRPSLHRTGLPVPWVRAQHWALLYDEFGLNCNFLWFLCLPIFLGTATVIYVLFLPLSCFCSLGWFRRNLRTSWFCVSCRYGCIVPVWYAVVCLQAWPYVSLRVMPWYAVLTLRAAVGLLLCWSRSAGFWGSLLCPVNVPKVS